MGQDTSTSTMRSGGAQYRSRRSRTFISGVPVRLFFWLADSPVNATVTTLFFGDPIVQWPRTPPFHGGNTGSNPVRVAFSAIGRG
jgi:hypothetical protein